MQHIMLDCTFTKQIWFYMGICQNLMQVWTSFEDIIDYACSLPTKEKCAFLMVVCAVCWVIWTTRNDITFRGGNVPSIRNTIFLICSLVHFWLGLTNAETRRLVLRWMPMDTDVIPLQVMAPQMMLT